MQRRDFSFVGILGCRDMMTSVIFHKYLFFNVQKSINAYHYLLPEMVVTNSQVYQLDLIAFMLAANQCNFYNMCRENSYAIVI